DPGLADVVDHATEQERQPFAGGVVGVVGHLEVDRPDEDALVELPRPRNVGDGEPDVSDGDGVDRHAFMLPARDIGSERAGSTRRKADHARSRKGVGRHRGIRDVHQAQRTSNGSSVVPGTSYDFAVFNVNGWLGHNGAIPGYTTVVVYLPERDASLVVFVNSDVPEQH